MGDYKKSSDVDIVLKGECVNRKICKTIYIIVILYRV